MAFITTFFLITCIIRVRVRAPNHLDWFFFRFCFDVEKPRGDEDMKVPEAPCHTFGSANSSAQTARQVCLFLMIRTVPCLIDYHSSETYPTKLILYGNSLPIRGALSVSFSGARSKF